MGNFGQLIIHHLILPKIREKINNHFPILILKNIKIGKWVQKIKEWIFGNFCNEQKYLEKGIFNFVHHVKYF